MSCDCRENSNHGIALASVFSLMILIKSSSSSPPPPPQHHKHRINKHYSPNDDDWKVTDGRDLPKSKVTEWEAGGTAKVAFTALFNHGGGTADFL